MVIGLAGLLVMALPAFRHGHAFPGHAGHGAFPGHAGHGAFPGHAGHGALPGHAGHGAFSGHGALRGHVPGHASLRGLSNSGARGNDGNAIVEQIIPADPVHGSRLRFIPSPRAVFSVLALYGAAGNAAVHAVHLSFHTAVRASAVPALLIEWVLVKPLWNLLFRFQADASSPLEHLILTEARAVIPFTNGRGMVSTVRDGRQVQFAAQLRSDQRALRVNVGDCLLIEDVDRARERVTVSIK
jgi:hypothetical protein